MKLHEKLKPSDYQIDGNFRNIANWRGRTHLANSSSTITVGDMDDIGYVFLKLQGDPAFIPVTRSDEHNTGYDLLRAKSKTWGIQPSEWFPLYTQDVGAYLHYANDRKTIKTALHLWYGYGGGPLFVRSTGQENLPKWRIEGRDFLKGIAPLHLEPGMILPQGRHILNALREFTQALTAGCNNPNKPWGYHHSPSQFRQLHKAAETILKLLETDKDMAFAALAPKKGFPIYNQFEAAKEKLRVDFDHAIAEKDVNTLEQLVLSHNGIKNRLHMAIQLEINSTKWKLSDLFGDLEQADAELRAMSSGLTPIEDDGISPGPKP
jgi:hypothetical protein